MITVSDTRYLTTLPNIITLQDEEGVYYYVHKSLYDQAVILEDRYSDAITALQDAIGGNKDLVAIKKYIEYAPDTIKILGHFLALMDSDVEDFTDIIGAMDIIASSVNLRNLIKQPKAIRSIVKFDMKFGNTYKDSWDNFFSTCYLYDDVVGKLSQPSNTQEYIDDDDDDYIDMEEINRRAREAMEALDSTPVPTALPESTLKEEKEEDNDSSMAYIKKRRSKLL